MAETKTGQVQFTIKADSKQAARAFLELTNAQKTTEKQTKRMITTMGKQESKMAKAQKQLLALAAGWISVQGAARLAGAAIARARAEQEKAKAGVKESEIPTAKLAQLAETPGEMRKLVQASREIQAVGGVSRGRGAAITFALESAGLLKDRRLFARIAGAGMAEDVPLLARAAKTIQTGLGGEAKSGNIREILSGGLAASKFSPATMEELLEGASQAAPFAAARGIGMPDILSGTALMATATGSASEGGQRVRALISAAQKKGIPGRSISEIIQNISGLGLDEQGIVKKLGRIEAVQAYQVIGGQMGQFNLQKQAIGEGMATDTIGRKLRLGEEIPAVMAARRSRFAEQGENIALERIGIAQMLTDSLQARFRTERLQGGAPVILDLPNNRVTRNLTNMTGAVIETLLGPEEFVRQFGDTAGSAPGSEPNREGAIMRRAIIRLDEAAQALKAAAQSGSINSNTE